VLQAVCATLPPLVGDDREAVMKLAAQGPPAEEVGLAPFAPPETMFPDYVPPTNQAHTRGGPVPLPSPTVLSRGVRA
jgi:nitrate reductase delta subunit